jgi:N-acetylmuramoyl-L-alanine amidase
MTRDNSSSPTSEESMPITGRVMRQLAISLAVAAGLATVFTAWTPASLGPGEIAGQLAESVGDGTGSSSTAFSGLDSGDEGGILRVGVVIGHAGPHPETGLVDPGTICQDGLTELEVNARIAEIVVSNLEAAGLQVNMLEEWDERLDGYRGVALVSIHADSCLPINEFATGFKVAAAVDSAVQDKTQRLVACLVDRYGRATDLRFHRGSITRDMTEYHTFNEIQDLTPAVVIETGFLHLDRALLANNPSKPARGIAEGILCYVNNEPADLSGGGTP